MRPISASSQAVRPPKSVGVAYLLWFFFGILGIHQFYLGNTARGVLYLLTCGILFIGVIVDLFTLPTQTRLANTFIAAGVR